MAAGETTLEFWQLILLAMGPAAIAATVAIVVPISLEARRHQIDRKKRRGEKLEELVSAIYDAGEWLDAVRDKNVLGIDRGSPRSPLDKIDTLTNIYFPQFNNLAYSLILAARQFHQWSLEMGQQRLASGKANSDGYLTKYEPFLVAAKQFTGALTSYGHHEFS